MRSKTSVKWTDKAGHSTGVVVQTQDWRLECNAQGELFDCPEVLALWTDRELGQLLEDLVSQHVPTWENALQNADPPDHQIKRWEPGYR